MTEVLSIESDILTASLPSSPLPSGRKKKKFGTLISPINSAANLRCHACNKDVAILKKLGKNENTDHLIRYELNQNYPGYHKENFHTAPFCGECLEIELNCNTCSKVCTRSDLLIKHKCKGKFQTASVFHELPIWTNPEFQTETKLTRNMLSTLKNAGVQPQSSSTSRRNSESSMIDTSGETHDETESDDEMKDVNYKSAQKAKETKNSHKLGKEIMLCVCCGDDVKLTGLKHPKYVLKRLDAGEFDQNTLICVNCLNLALKWYDSSNKAIGKQLKDDGCSCGKKQKGGYAGKSKCRLCRVNSFHDVYSMSASKKDKHLSNMAAERFDFRTEQHKNKAKMADESSDSDIEHT